MSTAIKPRPRRKKKEKIGLKPSRIFAVQDTDKVLPIPSGVRVESICSECGVGEGMHCSHCSKWV